MQAIVVRMDIFSGWTFFSGWTGRTYTHNLIWGPHFRVLRHWSLRDQRRTATTSCERHQSKVTLWNIYTYTHVYIHTYTHTYDIPPILQVKPTIHTYIHKWTSCMALNFKLWKTVELVIGPRSSLLTIVSRNSLQFQIWDLRWTERQMYSKFENNHRKNINFNLSLCPKLLDA